MGPRDVSERFVMQRRALIEVLRERGIRDLEILRAFDLVGRHEFVPDAVRHRAYEDAPVPIGFGQTASQPSLQALYMQTLGLEPTHRVLEIGTGSGFQTAVLAQLVSNVYSVERVRPLAEQARRTLDRLRVSNAAILVGDGTIGWSRYAPYDAILVAAAAPDVPQPLLAQLALGGKMLVPVGSLEAQRLTLVTRTAEGHDRREVLECTFVPLLGRFGWADAGAEVSPRPPR
jgi:protein-L-isoaspartate(D-aspartate) O-methyltransferase